MAKKKIVEISGDIVKLRLTSQRSSVRIADENGNHFAKPTLAKNRKGLSIEWMITNEEIEKLIDLFLKTSDKEKLKLEISSYTKFFRESQYNVRIGKKKNIFKKFLGLSVFKYDESFYSIEKQLNSKIRLKLTTKEGDLTLAPHLFILLPFGLKGIKIINASSSVKENTCLGGGCYALWKPTKSDIISITCALGRASEKHNSDLRRML
jgi:hypothetical protein